ncbi:hypothetical protein KQI89_05645 [Clostridium sp. MSJ-4]|uniref:ABC-2 family transporter protein n=1 Tax=Clostridium simiarum TaxID=2841506 RepID=A0ABS6EYD1_9CLOT|nr:hypothetical protein [Clostridium simiarum]MBU5591239.1 hypothetical protein [Clostridium simiarum]
MNTLNSIDKVGYNNKSKLDLITAYLSILKYNFKLILNLNLLAAIGFIILILTVSSLKLLDYKTLAKIGEMYISIIGIILMPYLVNMENKHNIKEVIYSRKTSHAKTILRRIIMVMILMFLMIASVMVLAKIQGSSFEFWEITFGTWISATFLGMIGITIVNLIDNISAAYLISFSYYFMEYVTKGKYTKDLYLFSLTKGSFVRGKYLLLFIILIMVIFNLLIVKKKS